MQKEKGVAQLFIVLLLALGIVFGVALVTRTQSFKTAPKASGPTISTDPVVSFEAPALGRTQVTWNTGDKSWGQVYYTENQEGEDYNPTETFFAEGSSGSLEANFLKPDHHLYAFNLYKGTEHSEVLASAYATNEYFPIGFLYANPNPVPTTPNGSGTTEIVWNSTAVQNIFDDPQMYLSVDNGDEEWFASGKVGIQQATIEAGHKYVFNLYTRVYFGFVKIGRPASLTVTANPILPPSPTPQVEPPSYNESQYQPSPPNNEDNKPLPPPPPPPPPSYCTTSCGQNNGEDCTNSSKANDECASYYNDSSTCSFSDPGSRGDGCIE